MHPTIDTIRFLNKNIKDLDQRGRLKNILPLWEALKIHMNETQFDLAVTALRMSADNIEVARLFLVEGKTAQQLNDDYSVSASRLSKVLKRVSENYEKQLNTLGLVNAQYTLDKKTARLVRELEASKINEAKMRTYVVDKKSAKKKKAAAKKPKK